MHIAIDATPLLSGHKDRGVGKYTRLLIDSLQNYESTHSYTLFERGQKVPENVDVVHYPYFDPFFLTLPLIKTKPTVVTVHDLIPIKFPDKFPRGIRGEVKWQIQRLALKGATRIIADSQSSKQDIMTFTGVNKRNITCVYLAPDPEIVAGAKESKERERYFIYVGDLNWNKNIYGLLEGFSRVKARVNLVVVGRAFLGKNLSEAVAVRERIKKLGLDASVKFVGGVSDAELGALYASSIGCVLPSFYEGFGLPVLEAMACGTPVICARGSSLDEIAGPALRVDAKDPMSIAEKLSTLVDLSQRRRKELVDRGREWSEKFTWEAVARETVRVYESCI